MIDGGQTGVKLLIPLPLWFDKLTTSGKMPRISGGEIVEIATFFCGRTRNDGEMDIPRWAQDERLHRDWARWR
jgi:hypothetical protein